MSKLTHSIIEMLHTFWEVICELWIPILSIGLFLVVICWISVGVVPTLIVITIGLLFVFIILVMVYIISTIILSKERGNDGTTG